MTQRVKLSTQDRAAPRDGSTFGSGTNAQQWTIIREVANGVEAYKISPVTALDLCLTVRPSTTGIQNENFIRLFPCADLRPVPTCKAAAIGRSSQRFLAPMSTIGCTQVLRHEAWHASRLNATHSILWVSNRLIEALPEPPSFLLQTVINTQYCVARNNVLGSSPPFLLLPICGPATATLKINAFGSCPCRNRAMETWLACFNWASEWIAGFVL
ncbi:hypothetical protein BCR44DRAFT_1247422 [Catenaria anguillulae PL171]|uniref:Uncharacterized protein n=1 Tax=Catenaria anguillulae PL171 TaxID=765915 RepID=A0A1Y2I0C0_9FUNG|nr:hypothetical protein BCR44DRAFT_1247422 [Catenaria anguillulae PL171]